MKKAIQSWLPFFLALALITVFAGLLRVYKLTLIPVFADEAIYIRWSQVMANEATLRFLPLSDGKQPLFMWVLMFLVRRFSDPLFIGRLVSVGAGLGSLLGVSAVSYLLFSSKKAAIATAMLYALSPYLYFFDRMALVDSMLSMWGIWTFVFAIFTVKTKRIDTAMVAGFMLGCAALTKSPALFIGLLIPSTWILALDTRSLKSSAITIAKLALLTILMWGIAFGMYNILRLGPNFHLLSSRTQDYVYPLSHILERPLDPLKPHFDRALSWISLMGPSSLFLLAVFGVVATPKKWRAHLMLLVWWIVPTLIQSEYAKVFTARYTLYTIPPLLIISGAAVMQKSKHLKSAVAMIVALFVAQSTLFIADLTTDPQKAQLPQTERSGYLEEWTAGTGIYDISEYLKNEAYVHPEKHIVVGTEGFFGTLPDGLQMYMEGISGVTVIGTGLNFDDVPQSLKDAKKAGDKVYLVVNKSRIQITEPYEARGLKLLEQYKKADRADFTREFVVHGPNEYLFFFEVL